MFKVGDMVEVKGSGFWMTVTKVLPGDVVQCRFGTIGRDAGKYPESILTPFEL